MATATAASSARAARTDGRRRKLAPRAAVLALAAAAMVPVARMGLANRLVRTDPARAAAIAPYDARIALAAARKAIESGARPDSPGVRRLVDRALARDVTQPAALELRALDANATGDERRQERLFQLSDRIGRRSLPTRLWLIQKAVDAGDVPGALRQFDIALRTSTAAPDVLFPVLAQAASDPALAAPLAQLLDRPSDWRLGFVHYAVTDGGAAAAIAPVMVRMRDRAALRRARLDQLLIGRLVAEQRFAQARTTYDAFHPGARPGLVRDPDFGDAGAVFPFGWGLAATGDAIAAKAPEGGRTVLAYDAQPGGSATVANQLVLLAPGAYRISAQTAAPPADGAPSPYWTVTCAEEGGGQLAVLEQPTIRAGWTTVAFTVPPDCPAQWLALVLRASELPSHAGAVAALRIEAR